MAGIELPNLHNRLARKVAWVTGGTSGIGEATAIRCAAEGAAVAINDINDEAGIALEKKLTAAGHQAAYFHCDVSSEKDVRSSIEKTVAQFGRLDVVVNVAGIVHIKLLHEYDEADWDRLMGVNVKSIFLSTKHAIPHLRKQKKSYIVNMGSISSFVAQSGTPAYTTSKGAVLQLSRSIACDYGQIGLRCNCVCPGITETPLLKHHLSQNGPYKDALKQRLRRVPMTTALSPDNVAQSVVYFSCEDSAGITGTSLVIDYGYTSVAEWDADVINHSGND